MTERLYEFQLYDRIVCFSFDFFPVFARFVLRPERVLYVVSMLADGNIMETRTGLMAGQSGYGSLRIRNSGVLGPDERVEIWTRTCAATQSHILFVLEVNAGQHIRSERVELKGLLHVRHLGF